MDVFIIRCDVIAIVIAELKEAIAPAVMEWAMEAVEDTIAVVIQVELKSAKQWIKKLIFHLVEEGRTDFVKNCRFSNSIECIDYKLCIRTCQGRPAQQVVGSSVLIEPMSQLV